MRHPLSRNRLCGRTGLPMASFVLFVLLGTIVSTGKAGSVSGGFLGFEDAPQNRKQVLSSGVEDNGSDSATQGLGALARPLQSTFDRRGSAEKDVEHGNDLHKEVAAQPHTSFLERLQPAQNNRTQGERQVMFVASGISSPPLLVFQHFSPNNYKAAGEAGVSPRTVRLQPKSSTTVELSPGSSIANISAPIAPAAVHYDAKTGGQAISQ